MTKVISILNFKAGVGKTTITVALSEFLAEEKSKKVLLIDLDPQTNATVSLISQRRWKELDDAGRTISQLFRDAIEGSHIFKIDKSIINNVSNVHNGIARLSLLPSSLSLTEIDYRLAFVPSISHYTLSPTDILANSISSHLTSFDYVFIDCPANFGLITMNGLRICDYYLIPVIPDILSTLGIPQILSLTKEFANRLNAKPVPLGIILSKVKQVNLHKSVENMLRESSAKGAFPRIFESKIIERVRAAEAMDYETKVMTLKQKYGYTSYDDFESLTREFLRVVNDM